MVEFATGITVKLDLYGSTSSLGVVTNRRDRAVRRAIVTGLTATVGDGTPEGQAHRILQTAQEKALDAVGLFHNTILDLPLQDIRARQFGQSKVWVDLIYHRDFRTLNTPGNNEAFAFTRTVDATTKVYRHTLISPGDDTAFELNGLPSGPMYGNSLERLRDPKVFPWHYMWARVATLIVIPTVLSSHPYEAAGVSQRIGSVNSDQVDIGQVSFAPFTLRFLSSRVDLRRGGQGATALEYHTQHHFLAIDKGHYHQMPIFASDDPPKGPPLFEWTTVETVEWPQETFAGVFPIGT